MSKSYPCPECGAQKMALTVENCTLEDGLVVKRLQHLKCKACDSRFFDDDAMHRIQDERTKRAVAHTA